MKRLLGAAILGAGLVGCGDRLQPEGVSVTPRAMPTTTATTTPYDPPKTSPTFAPAISPILGVRWLYLSDKKTLQLQERTETPAC